MDSLFPSQNDRSYSKSFQFTDKKVLLRISGNDDAKDHIIWIFPAPVEHLRCGDVGGAGVSGVSTGGRGVGQTEAANETPLESTGKEDHHVFVTSQEVSQTGKEKISSWSFVRFNDFSIFYQSEITKN